MPRAARWLALAALYAVGTVLAGWWGVPVVAALIGVSRREDAAAVGSALAALAGWALLLAVDAADSRVPDLARLLGSMFGVPASWLVVLTLLFPALVAWSATVLAQVVASVAVDRRRAA